MYDLIGDIHGHASVLKALLLKLGYERRNGTYRHPGRKIIFVGDYIDRGPEIPETLKLVRTMVEAGEATALMGNHEFNAIMFNEADGNGGYLRPHSKKNKRQHRETLRQFADRIGDYESYIEWFKSLPVYYESEGFRAVHACWDSTMIDEMREFTVEGVLESRYIMAAGERDSRLYEMVNTLLKGKEIVLPGDETFRDKDGHERREARVKWWLDPREISFGDWCLNEVVGLQQLPVDPQYHSHKHYKEHFRPVFFGHYWLTGTPVLQRSNVCCLDYSIGKQDKLVAYRFEGEEFLRDQQLEWVEYR